MRRVPFDINLLVQQVIKLTEARWRDGPLQSGPAIRVQTELADTLPAVYGAESELREVLISLVFNAVDAMPTGGVMTFRTCQAPTASDHDSIQVEVVDSGVGMDEPTRGRCLAALSSSEDNHPVGRVFDKVHAVLRRHGASLDIDSAPGHGTTVRLLLPSADTSDLPATDWAALDDDSNTVHGMYVLLIDDDPLLVRSVGDALTDAGHRVCTAGGGREGIEAFTAACHAHDTFDVVITDLGMPHVDGRQVAQAVKAISPKTPVVMLTGWGQRMAADGDCPPGVDHLMSKPPRIAMLQQVLARCQAAMTGASSSGR